MDVKFYPSPYERMMHNSDHAETLFGHSVSDGSLVALGTLYKTSDGKFVARYFNPELEHTFDSRDEAANYLVIISTSQAEDLRFLSPNL